jgi:VIT1/CCC1 family predicted Fe2+/Mn2+ transporter
VNEPRLPSSGYNRTAVVALLLAFVLPPVGIVLGHVSRRQIRRRGQGGGTVATAALFVGYLIMFVCGCGLPLSIAFQGH